jgi:hypothetical protein
MKDLNRRSPPPSPLSSIRNTKRLRDLIPDFIAAILDPVSSLFIRGEVLLFRSRAMSAMTRDSGDSCSPLPVSLSPRPTPPYRFVENKSQSAIRPSGDRTVETLFLSFLPVESVSFSWSFHTCNPLPTHRSAVGRNDIKLRGAKTAALRTVIVSERRSRESNDLKPSSKFG